MASASVELKSSIEAELNEHYQKKREIEDNINELQGRPTRKQREEALANGEDLIPHPASRDRQRISDQGLPRGGGIYTDVRSRLSMDNRRRRYDDTNDDVSYNTTAKRNRLSLNERFAERDPDREARMGAYGRRERRTATQAYGQSFVDADIIEEVKGKSVQSEIVVMPMIDSKSRDEAIKEQETEVKPEVKQRNRRLFANILGTLQTFRKTKTAHEDEQKRKQEEIDRKLEEEKRRSKEEMLLEKRKLVANSREEQEKIKTLQRKRAQIQIAEREMDRMKLLGNYIMLAGKPPIFYLPAKHTLRTLELQKTTRKKFEERILARQEELDRDLKQIDEKFGGRLNCKENGDERELRNREDRRANTEEREMRREERDNETAIDTQEMRERRNMVTPTSDVGDEDDIKGVDKVEGHSPLKKEEEVEPPKSSEKKKKSMKQKSQEAESSSSSDSSSSESDDD